MDRMPSMILIGRRFWMKCNMGLNFSTNVGTIEVDEMKLRGQVRKRVLRGAVEDVDAVIEDEDLDKFIKEDLDVSQFSSDDRRRNWLRKLICDHRQIFEGFACITGHSHTIKLKPGTSPMCISSRCRFPKEEELEGECMSRLLQRGALEELISPCAFRNVFVPKKDFGIRVTTNFGALKNVTGTNTYPMEDVQLNPDWLDRKKV